MACGQIPTGSNALHTRPFRWRIGDRRHRLPAPTVSTAAVAGAPTTHGLVDGSLTPSTLVPQTAWTVERCYPIVTAGPRPATVTPVSNVDGLGAEYTNRNSGRRESGGLVLWGRGVDA